MTNSDRCQCFSKSFLRGYRGCGSTAPERLDAGLMDGGWVGALRPVQWYNKQEHLFGLASSLFVIPGWRSWGLLEKARKWLQSNLNPVFKRTLFLNFKLHPKVNKYNSTKVKCGCALQTDDIGGGSVTAEQVHEFNPFLNYNLNYVTPDVFFFDFSITKLKWSMDYDDIFREMVIKSQEADDQIVVIDADLWPSKAKGLVMSCITLYHCLYTTGAGNSDLPLLYNLVHHLVTSDAV